MRHEETPLSIGLVILIVLIGIFVESCWSGSVADSDIHSHKYIVVAGKYYPTEDIEYIETDVVFHDKHVIIIHFEDGTTYLKGWLALSFPALMNFFLSAVRMRSRR